MSEAYAKPVPTPDIDSAPFWDGVRAGELRIQRCTDCGIYRWPARVMCGRCYGFNCDWPTVSGRGTVESWITTHRAFLPVFKPDVPYTTLTVRLAEQNDIFLIGAFADPKTVPTRGMAVQAVMQPVTDEDTLVLWKPA